jgi:hypothetical protein
MMMYPSILWLVSTRKLPNFSHKFRNTTKAQVKVFARNIMHFSKNKIPSIVALVAIGTQTSMAQFQLRGPGGRPGGRRPGGRFPPAFNASDFVDITCAGNIDFSCDPRGNETEGVFVCRSRINKFNETKSRPRCIPTDKALEGDECGCCGRECPAPCDICPCETSRGQGFEVLIDDEIACLPPRAAMMEVYKNDMAVCNDVCTTV